MKNKKIILAGGTGFMGQEMTKYFGKENKMSLGSANNNSGNRFSVQTSFTKSRIVRYYK